MTLADLRRALELLPEGSALTLPREVLLEALGEVGGTTDAGDLTVAQVAERFGRCESTVRSWLTAGLLRGYRLRGREWRIPAAALAEFEQAERAGRGAEAGAGGSADLGAWRRTRGDD